MKKSTEPSKKPERKKVCDWAHSHSLKPTTKCKHTQPAALRNLRENSHGIIKALGPRGGSYILDAESCSIQPLEIDRLFIGSSGRFVETRLRVYQDLKFRKCKQREIPACDSRN